MINTDEPPNTRTPESPAEIPTRTVLDAGARSPEAEGAALLRGAGAVVWRGALGFDSPLRRIAAAVDSAYLEFEALLARHGTFGVAAHLPATTRCQPTAASLGLDAVVPPEEMLELLPDGLVELARRVLGGEPAIDVDICWLRRQYPERTRPKGQAPHAFHQDGAYGFDFSAHPAGAAQVPPLLTFWLPLGPAGHEAPGLELVPRSPHRLLGLAELHEANVNAHWPVEERVRPVLEPGDLVLMAGHHLHRTHVTGAMSKVRTSVELRLVRRDAVHPVFAAHRLLPLGG